MNPAVKPQANPCEATLTDAGTFRDTLNSFIEAREKEFDDLKKRNVEYETKLKEYEERLAVENERSVNLSKEIANLEYKFADCQWQLQKTKDGNKMQLKASCKSLEEDNRRLNLQVKDLGEQVCMLLKEAEKRRSGHMLLNSCNSSDQVTSSSQVVTRGIVPFGNVEELVKRNCELVAKLRQMKKQYKEEKKKDIEAIREEMETSMRYTLKEIQERQMVDAISEEKLTATQRMLAEAEENLENLKCQLKDKEILQDHVTSLKDEVNSLKDEVNLLKEEITNLNTELGTKTDQLNLNAEELKRKDESLAEQVNTFLQDIEKFGRKCKKRYKGLAADVESSDNSSQKRAKMAAEVGANTSSGSRDPEELITSEIATNLGNRYPVRKQRKPPRRLRDPNMILK